MRDKEIAVIVGGKTIEGLTVHSRVDATNWDKGCVLLVPEDELFSVFKKGSRIELHQMYNNKLNKFYATISEVDMPARHITVVDLEEIGDKEGVEKKTKPVKELEEGYVRVCKDCGGVVKKYKTYCVTGADGAPLYGYECPLCKGRSFKLELLFEDKLEADLKEEKEELVEEKKQREVTAEEMLKEIVVFHMEVNFRVFEVMIVMDHTNKDNKISLWTSNQKFWVETLREVHIGDRVKLFYNYTSGREEVYTMEVKEVSVSVGILTLEMIGRGMLARAAVEKEAVNHPSHYQLGDLGIEALDVMEATMTKEQLKGFYIGNVQKYTLRAAEKNGLEDFKKALFYLNKLVELMEGE